MTNRYPHLFRFYLDDDNPTSGFPAALLIAALLLLLTVSAGCGSAYVSARRNMDAGFFEDAVRSLKQQGPVNAEGWALLAECYVELGNYSELALAVDRSLQVSDEFRTQLEYLVQRAAIDLQNEMSESFAAKKYALTAELAADAISLFQLTQRRDLPFQPGWTERELLLLEGEAYIQLGQWKDALTPLEQAKELCGECLDVLQRLALAYSEMGMYKRSFETAEIILSLQPDQPDALLWRAEAIENLGDSEEVLNAYLDIMQYNKTVDRAYLHRRIGLLLYEAGEWSRARKHLEAYLQSGDEERTQGEQTQIEILVGVCLFNEGRFAQARSYFERVLTQEPDNTDIRRYIGVCQWFTDHREAAKQTFFQAEKEMKNNGSSTGDVGVKTPSGTIESMDEQKLNSTSGNANSGEENR